MSSKINTQLPNDKLPTITSPGLIILVASNDFYFRYQKVCQILLYFSCMKSGLLLKRQPNHSGINQGATLIFWLLGRGLYKGNHWNAEVVQFLKAILHFHFSKFSPQFHT